MLYAIPATRAHTTRYDAPMSRICRSVTGAVPVWMRYARMPSLTTVPTTCAVATNTAVRQAPSTQPVAPSPTSARTIHPIGGSSVTNADTTIAPTGWSPRLARLVLAQSSQFRWPPRRTSPPPALRRTRPRRPADRPSASPEEGGAGLLHVLGDLRDEGFDPLVRAHLAQPRREVQRQPLAVQVAVEVQDVRLDAAFPAGDRRVRADRP